MVEHDEEAIRMADHVVDMGPGAGVHGGRVVAQGTADQIASTETSLTGQYLSGTRRIEIPARRHPVDEQCLLHLQGARGNNLKGVDLTIPIGLFTCITGVSGSGKSTLVNDTLYPLAANRLNGANLKPAPFDDISGLDLLDKVVDIDQSPIGRTPRSNPATYTGLFTPIRELFAATPEARARGYGPGRFSFNVKGGRCEACGGDGVIKVEMHFLPDVYVQCDVCKGKRYNRETLEIRYKGKSIREVLEMTVEEALPFFDAVPPLKRKLETLIDVGLSYVQLGQNATTLSGGEAQRVKLARELSKRDTGRTLYILDEPTTGLHFHDIEPPARRPEPPARPRQHRGGHRAQPRRDQDRRLDRRPGPRRRGRRRADHRHGDTGGDCVDNGLAHGEISCRPAAAQLARLLARRADSPLSTLSSISAAPKDAPIKGLNKPSRT